MTGAGFSRHDARRPEGVGLATFDVGQRHRTVNRLIGTGRGVPPRACAGLLSSWRMGVYRLGRIFAGIAVGCEPCPGAGEPDDGTPRGLDGRRGRGGGDDWQVCAGGGGAGAVRTGVGPLGAAGAQSPRSRGGVRRGRLSTGGGAAAGTRCLEAARSPVARSSPPVRLPRGRGGRRLYGWGGGAPARWRGGSGVPPRKGCTVMARWQQKNSRHRRQHGGDDDACMEAPSREPAPPFPGSVSRCQSTAGLTGGGVARSVTHGTPVGQSRGAEATAGLGPVRRQPAPRQRMRRARSLGRSRALLTVAGEIRCRRGSARAMELLEVGKRPSARPATTLVQVGL